MGHYAKAYLYLVGYEDFIARVFPAMLRSLKRFPKSEVAQQRMKIIKFYEEYGEKATKIRGHKLVSPFTSTPGEFDEELKKGSIPHYFFYPRFSRINASLERYKRTIQEEFIDNNLDIIQPKPLFHERLADYLIFYNTQRPHKSLGLKSPVEYLIERGLMSQISLTYTKS